MVDLILIDQKTIQLLTVLTIALIVWLILQIFIKKLVNNMAVGTPQGLRLTTLTSVVRSAISVLILGFTVFESLSILGVDLAPLIAAAGVSGLAIGFGAQTLVKDIISGFFILAEDQFRSGDEIEISGKRGVVQKVSLRTVWLREKDDTLHIIPSGSIVVVTNFTRQKTSKIKSKLDKRKT